MTRKAEPRPCAHETLAESDNVSIARCSAGTIHLQMGPLTLSLTASEFAEVAAVIVAAITRLEHARPRAAGRTH
jgi:hypothetical protein